MMLRHLSREMTRRLPQWDLSSRLALGIALVLLVLMLVLGFTGPPALRWPARIGAFGLLLSLQLLFLWANRRDASPYHQAQQHFVAGEYGRARALLEGIPERSRVSVDALVLLGNTYRHLGLYPASRRALTQALQHKPRHHLALFSAGKLHLVCGDYERARDFIARALEAGAPPIVTFELGQAHYMLGECDPAIEALEEAGPLLADDPPLLLMQRFLLFRLGQGALPDRPLIDAGMAFWRDEAAKHAGMPYGAQLRAALAQLEDARESVGKRAAPADLAPRKP